MLTKGNPVSDHVVRLSTILAALQDEFRGLYQDAIPETKAHFSGAVDALEEVLNFAHQATIAQLAVGKEDA